VYTRTYLTDILARILARKIARVSQVGGQVGEDPRACPSRTNGQHYTAADCQLFLWQAERTTRRHSRDDPREDVGVGPVEFQLNCYQRCTCMRETLNGD